VQDQDRLGQDQDLKKMVLRSVLIPRPVLRTTSLDWLSAIWWLQLIGTAD